MRLFTVAVGLGLLSGLGCADLVLKSHWGAPAALALADGPDAEGSGIVIDAQNDADFLYLMISSRSEHVKSQMLGAFLQDFFVWFDPSDKQRPQSGVRVAFHRQPGVGFPHYESEQKEYMRAATREVGLMQGGWRGSDRILNPNSKEIELITEMFKGQLIVRMRLPLNAEKGWSIGSSPGQTLGIMLECSPIDPEIAQLELIREYQESYFGWGWGNGPNAYGPKQGYGPQKNLGLGSYEAAGMDKGIYATHGVYRPLSWASVPQRLDARVSLRLATAPAF